MRRLELIQWTPKEHACCASSIMQDWKGVDCSLNGSAPSLRFTKSIVYTVGQRSSKGSFTSSDELVCSRCHADVMSTLERTEY